jgi:hypothetical protein
MQNKPGVTGIDVKTVISNIKQAIADAEKQVNDPDMLRIESLSLTLKTMVELDTGGGFSLTIPVINLHVGANVSLKQEEMQTVVMTLEPPQPIVPHKEIASRLVVLPPLKSSLANAIVMIRDGVKAAPVGDPPLTLDKATVELSFVVGEEGDIEVVFKGAQNIEVTNTLKLELGETKSEPVKLTS